MPIFPVNLAAIRTACATRLPKTYEPLTLTFYGLGARQKGDFITFANDTYIDLCVSVKDGRVYGIDPSGRLAVKFVNSGFEQFISFFNKYVELSEAVMKLRPALEAIDKDALGDVNKYWEPAVEQLEDD